MGTAGRRLLLPALAALLLAAAGGWWHLQQVATQQREALLKGTEEAARAATPQSRAHCEAALEPLKAALAELSAEPEHSADVVRGHRALAQCLTQLKRHAQAATELRAAIEVRTEHAPLHGELALALSRSEQHQAARQAARLAVQLDPQAWRAHLLQARVLEAARDADAAAAAYEEALRLAPADGIAIVEQALEALRQRHPHLLPTGDERDESAEGWADEVVVEGFDPMPDEPRQRRRPRSPNVPPPEVEELSSGLAPGHPTGRGLAYPLLPAGVRAAANAPTSLRQAPVQLSA